MGYTYRGSLKDCTEGNTAIIQMKDASAAGVEQVDQFARAQLADFKAHYLLRPGDLIFRSRGLTNTCALITKPLARTICIAPLMFIRVNRPDLISPAYLHWYINLPDTQQTIATFARGEVVRMISTTAMGTLEVLLPPLVRQQEIIAVTETARQIAALEAELIVKRKQYSEQALLRYARGETLQAGGGVSLSGLT
ncbi:MAG: hypothetical protein RL748_244 [Pseudomonadota bacterium]